MNALENKASALLANPLSFVALCWPEMKLYDRQRQVLLSVAENLETFVHAANQTGKTRIAAIAALHFYLSRTPARVVITSSSETQLVNILWTEILRLIDTSAHRLPLQVNNLVIKKLRRGVAGPTDPQDYLLGHVTNLVENFQGHHLPQDVPRVLAVFDEASGVADEFYDAADSWAHRKLVIGNPLSNTNFFYRHCKAGDVGDPAGEADLLRKVIHIDGRDSPNVRVGELYKQAGDSGTAPVLIPGLLSYADYERRRQGWDLVKRTTRLHGHFYEGDEAMLFPPDWLDQAMDPERWSLLHRPARTPTALGVDVAAGGRDKTCWTLVDEFGLFEQTALDTPNTMEVVGRTIRLIEDYQLSPGRVVLDAGGGGTQIADRLWEQNYGVVTVNFGETPDAKQAYKNRRAELFGELRKHLDPHHGQPVFAFPPDALTLRQELAVFPLLYDSEGKLYLPPKTKRPGSPPGVISLRGLLGRSPDRADSLALAVWALDQPVYSPFLDVNPIAYDANEPRPTRSEVETWDEPMRWMALDAMDRRAHRDWDDDSEDGWITLPFATLP